MLKLKKFQLSSRAKKITQYIYRAYAFLNRITICCTRSIQAKPYCNNAKTRIKHKTKDRVRNLTCLNYRIQDFDTVGSITSLPAFRRKLHFSSSGSVKMIAVRFSEIAADFYQNTRRLIPKDRRPVLHSDCCENLMLA